MLVVIIIFKLKPIDIESFLLIFRTIRLCKTLKTGPPRMNEVEDLVNHEMDPLICVSIDILRVHRHGLVRIFSQMGELVR